jgi:dipeptidyl aminopeptidase/acylaminoacyl peptidase
VVAFDAAIPVARGIFDNTPYLRRQFSPDGKSMVFSIDGQLVVIDLVTGQAKPLGVQGFYPSWSRDGSQIAFVFESPSRTRPCPEAIGLVPAAGGSPRELTVECIVGRSVEWSPDGSRIFFSHYGPDAVSTETMEVATGRIGPTHIGLLSPSYAHWRVGSPELAVTTQLCARSALASGEFARIVGIDERTGSQRTLVDVADPCVEVQEPGGYTGVRDRVQLRDPRWSPAVADELLYVAERGTAGVAADDFEAHVVNIATGKDTRLPISAYEATWTWDGSAVAYLVKSPGSSFGSAVRVWKRDGSGETELRRATIGEAFFSIASVGY